jgi:Golgi nucleoside diphosphatase
VKNEEIMFDLIKEVREEQKEIRQDLHLQNAVFREHLVTDAKMYEELAKISFTLAVNTQSLKEHMQQTVLVREQTDILKRMYETQKQRMDDLTKPITVKEVLIKFSKFCGWVSAVAGAIYGISRFL